MNELKIFKSEDGEEIKIAQSEDGRRKRFYINNKEVDRFELLECALFTDSQREAFAIMSLASLIFGSLGDTAFNSLYNATYAELIRNHSENEFCYHKLFKEHISELINGAEITNVKTINKNYPDAWVRLGGLNIPVEIKKNRFDASALKQLTRYINTYGSSYGIAVASSLNVELPSNITFISVSEMKALESNENIRTLGVGESIKDLLKSSTKKD